MKLRCVICDSSYYGSPYTGLDDDCETEVPSYLKEELCGECKGSIQIALLDLEELEDVDIELMKKEGYEDEV